MAPGIALLMDAIAGKIERQKSATKS